MGSPHTQKVTSPGGDLDESRFREELSHSECSEPAGLDTLSTDHYFQFNRKEKV